MNDPIITFGKHRGSPISELDAGYLGWVLRTGTADPYGRLGEFVEAHGDAIRETINGAGRRAAERFEVTYNLNDSQAEAVDTIERELLQGDANLFRLEGGAGYGKSFTVMELVRRALLAGFQVKACATSYVATQVLAAQLETIGVEARTIASTIRLAKIELEDREEYQQTSDTHDMLVQLLGKGNLLIVDEYSMVGDDIADAMMEAACMCGGKLLVVGDLHQLPPVKQNRDSSFSRIPGSVTLTQPMRYDNTSDLFMLEQLARHQPAGVFNGGWKDSTQVTLHDDMNALFDRFIADMRAAPGEDARMLFFRRADVLEANTRIRRELHGAVADHTPVVEDERLMVMSTSDWPTGTTDSNGKEIKLRFYSGQTYLVEQVRETTHEGIPCYMVTLDDGASTRTVPVIFAASTTQVADARGSDEYQRRLNELREEALETGQWAEWRRFKNNFVLVGYNYAMTVHRAQGQTIDRVYFSPATLRRSGAMADKLLYVAATRAKKAAHMVRTGGGA